MGQMQQICAKNISNCDSSITDLRERTIKRECFKNKSSKKTYQQQCAVITETINELKLQLPQDEDKQNYDVETNISIVESIYKQETKNHSQRELDEITDLNANNKTDGIKNRSKSVFIHNILPEIPPKSILKNKEVIQDQEKRNSSQQKRVRFSEKLLQKYKLLPKQTGYKIVSYI
ncbi:unnamed protein product (macronuclear) [Paramecium tetraurelia]|uniref:Uncharacterized protein n=1 Tax=Paramecium tetraurelia TaxID=5888 RepID=A0D770_PARTE|nr:uncharacterized protein GSPATT00001928001 [Paramecium tetraurelia]CAK78887.1 unnamed protein product [Paramecium tetraurelia]|eukprot:XP_001446284.1 hypothetical protein (macronuclear) [Paramecium tetraurelia strain d4-2]